MGLSVPKSNENKTQRKFPAIRYVHTQLYEVLYTSLPPQDAELGTLVTTIQAMDPDFQLNGIVGYYFENLTLLRGPFQINRDSGEIRLRTDMEGELDREVTEFYEVGDSLYIIDSKMHSAHISLIVHL